MKLKFAALGRRKKYVFPLITCSISKSQQFSNRFCDSREQSNFLSSQKSQTSFPKSISSLFGVLVLLIVYKFLFSLSFFSQRGDHCFGAWKKKIKSRVKSIPFSSRQFSQLCHVVILLGRREGAGTGGWKETILHGSPVKSLVIKFMARVSVSGARWKRGKTNEMAVYICSKKEQDTEAEKRTNRGGAFPLSVFVRHWVCMIVCLYLCVCVGPGKLFSQRLFSSIAKGMPEIFVRGCRFECETHE